MTPLVSLLLITLSFVSSMPLRPESGQPVMHSHAHRIPHLHGIQALQEQILIASHRESLSRTEQPSGNHYLGGGYPWMHQRPSKPVIVDDTFDKHITIPTIQPTSTIPTTTPTPTQVPTKAPTIAPFPLLSPDTSAPGSHGIAYGGGSVMTNPVRVYLVYYGSWTTPQAQQAIGMINTFVTNMGTSAWWNIQTSYYQPNPTTGTRAYVKNGITLGGYVVTGIDRANGGTDLTDANVVTIISSQITSKNLPYDADGVYMMISSSEVMQTGFCSSDCGWHSAARVSGTSMLMKHGWVGDATTRCISQCTAFAQMNSPNGNKAADGIISILAHEIAEAVSDPYLNAWQTSYTENADKCAWNFVKTYMTSNGAQANMNIAGHDYLVQSNWKNRDGGGCVLSL